MPRFHSKANVDTDAVAKEQNLKPIGSLNSSRYSRTASGSSKTNIAKAQPVKKQITGSKSEEPQIDNKADITYSISSTSNCSGIAGLPSGTEKKKPPLKRSSADFVHDLERTSRKSKKPTDDDAGNFERENIRGAGDVLHVMPKKRTKTRESITVEQTRKTQLDQIVEVCSNSTTETQKVQRAQRLGKLKLNPNKSTNKCDTESTSEFPVSSPSNPLPDDHKFQKRNVLLKNTLPADNFERGLAMITSRNPQMTLEEKILAWKFSSELSEVEDVKEFDNLFEKREKNAIKTNDINDFNKFRERIIESFKTQQFRKISEMKGDNEKPSTSNAAKIAPNRRSRNTVSDVANKKHRPQSISSSSSSSSKAFLKQKQTMQSQAQLKSQHQPAVLVYEKMLCPSSSEDTNHAGSAIDLKANQKQNSPNGTKKQLQHKQSSNKNSNKSNRSPPLNLRRSLNDEDSVFRDRRLNPDIDKNPNGQGLIKIRYDFRNGINEKHLKNTAGELFKTPEVPITKYLSLSTQKSNAYYKVNNNSCLINNMNNDINGNRNSLLNCSNNSKSDKPTCKSNSLKTMYFIKHPKALEGQNVEFHQQHEFCNYLGLTGMSTANALASAVAELSKCNLARRSLRVRRLQQIEKKDKIMEATRQQMLNSPKSLNEEQLVGVTTLSNKYNNSILSESGGSSRTPLSPFGMTNTSRTISSPSPINSSLMKNEMKRTVGGIKIDSQITASNKGDIEEITKDLVKQFTMPIKQTLLKHLKKRSKKAAPSNGTSTCPRSSHSDETEETISNRTPKRRMSGGKQSISSTSACSQSQRLHERGKQTKSPSQQQPQQKFIMDIVKTTKTTTVNGSNEADGTNNVRERFQKYLEHSRQTKPSIYIVQAIENETLLKREISTEKKSTGGKILTLSKHSLVNKNITNTSSVKNETAVLKKSTNAATSLSNGKLHTNKFKSTKKISTRATRSFSTRKLRNNKSLMDCVKTSMKAKGKIQSKNAAVDEKLPNTHQLNKNPIQKLVDRSTNKCKVVTKKSLESTDNQSNLSTTTIMDVKKSTAIPNLSLPQYNRVDPQNSKNNSHYIKSNVKSLNYQAIRPLWYNSKPVTNSKLIQTNPITIIESNNAHKVNNFINILNVNNTAEVPKVKITKDAASMISVETKESATQSVLSSLRSIHHINEPGTPMENPLAIENGNVLHIYYEFELLIVIQELRISFWKFAKVLNVLTKFGALTPKESKIDLLPEKRQNCSSVSVLAESCDASNDWMFLGHCRRLINDIEVAVPYANRLCTNTLTPIYTELRCHEYPQGRRECALLSTYLNVYYLNEDDNVVNSHSVQLDTVQSSPCNVTYTTLTDSRYFVMCWPQANSLGRTRCGLCKYSLSPNLNSLASIREFKSLKHTLRQLESIEEDKLLGLGDSQMTIWDHRSGDVLMNYDLHMSLGRNLGSIFYPSLDIGLTNRMLLFQYIKDEQNAPELAIIACDISHINPSHRVLQRQELPQPEFNDIVSAVNTGDHILITAQSDDEIWISTSDPNMITCVPAQKTKRFYMRDRPQLIELTENSLMIDSFANHVLKLAAKNLQ